MACLRIARLPNGMKTNTKKTRPKGNGVLLGREELLAAHHAR